MKKFKRVLAIAIVFAVLVGCMTGISLSADEYDNYPIAENNSLKGKIIFLDAGHGKGNYNGEGGYYEHEGNLTIALLVKENLERCGATVYMTRPDENDVDSYARMAYVNQIALSEIQNEYIAAMEKAADEAEVNELQGKIDEITELMAVMQSVIDDPELSPKYFNSPWHIDKTMSRELKKIFEYEEHSVVGENMLFLSIHTNAFSSSSANGTVTYYLSNDFKDNAKYCTNYAFADQSKAFAQLMQDEVVTAGDFYDRGLAINNFFMIREHNVPGALLEVAFYTNPSDRAKLMSETYQKRICSGITYAIQDYFEIYSPEPEPTPGDVDGDGMISNTDLIYTARYIVCLETEINMITADMNGDGEITNSDLISIAQIVVGTII